MPSVCQLVISRSLGDEAPSDEEELSEGELSTVMYRLMDENMIIKAVRSVIIHSRAGSVRVSDTGSICSIYCSIDTDTSI